MKNIVLIFLLFPLSVFAQSPRNYSFYNDSCNYNLKTYRFELWINDSSSYIQNSVSIKAISNTELGKIFFEFNSLLTIDTVLLNGDIVSYTNHRDLLCISLPNAIKRNTTFNVRIVYHGKIIPKGLWGGFRNQYDKRYNTSVTWTLSEPYFANAWFPCKQQLTDKIDTLEMNIIVPRNKKGASNGLLKSIIPVDKTHDCYKWISTYPIAYYLIFAAVADYQDYSYYIKIPKNSYDFLSNENRNFDQPDSLLVQNYIYNTPEVLEKFKQELDRTGEIIKLYSTLFGPYPFMKEKYGHAMAPFSGGMEHQTMSLMYYFDFHLVAHELAHQWFGNYVTCSDWQNIFINESMASYAEYIAIEYLESTESAKDWMVRAQDLARNESKGTVYVPHKDSLDEKRIFSYELSYKKGALVLHALRNEINNDSLFFSTMRSYLYHHRYATASIKDFQDEIERYTNNRYETFFAQWIYGEGYPEYKIKTKKSSDKIIVFLNQRGSSKATPLFNITLEFLVEDDNGKRIVRHFQEKNKERFEIVINGNLREFKIDPKNKTLKKVNMW